MKPILITGEGKSLIAAAFGGEAPIKFTRITTLDAEKNTMQSTPVSGVSKSGDLCEVFGVLDNSGVSEGYCIQGLQLFAQGNSPEAPEILFGSCTEDSDAFYMPAGAVNSRTEVTVRIALTAECAENIILRPNSDAYASAVRVYEEIARLNAVIENRISDHDRVSDEKILELGGRLEVLETVLQGGSMTNSAVLTFGDLNGVLFNGIWNKTLNRIEF